MIYNTKYNKDADFEQVVPDLAIDIEEAMQTGVINNITASKNNYTNEDDINAVGHYVSDNIDAFVALQNLGKSVAGNTEVQPSKGE